MTYIRGERMIPATIVDKEGVVSRWDIDEDSLLQVVSYVFDSCYRSGLPPGSIHITGMQLELNVRGTAVEIQAEDIWVDLVDYLNLDRKLLK